MPLSASSLCVPSVARAGFDKQPWCEQFPVADIWWFALMDKNKQTTSKKPQHHHQQQKNQLNPKRFSCKVSKVRKNLNLRKKKSLILYVHGVELPGLLAMSVEENGSSMFVVVQFNGF